MMGGYTARYYFILQPMQRQDTSIPPPLTPHIPDVLEVRVSECLFGRQPIVRVIGTELSDQVYTPPTAVSQEGG